MFTALTVDVEDCFHILDSPAARNIEQWNGLESLINANHREDTYYAVKEQCKGYVLLAWMGCEAA